jgi:hypothetical protein
MVLVFCRLAFVLVSSLLGSVGVCVINNLDNGIGDDFGEVGVGLLEVESLSGSCDGSESEELLHCFLIL